jgi:phosphotransferase system enzyme I (PtsI)
MAMTTIRGIPVSEGIEIAKAHVYKPLHLKAERREISDPQAECSRFMEAVSAARAELTSIKEIARSELGKERAKIFHAQLLVLDDPDFLEPVTDTIGEQSANAEFALAECSSQLVEMFETMSDPYMRERAADIRDLSLRVLAKLTGNQSGGLTGIGEAVVIVAEDLTPSDTLQLDRTYVRGFVTDSGGSTSHSAIIARSLGIPAIVGTQSATQAVKHGVTVIIDGMAGEMIVDPPAGMIMQYQEKKTAYEAEKRKLAELVHAPTVTRDGHSVELAANIASVDDLQAVLDNGAEAVGLFRTEFLYLGRDRLPTEDEQFEAYKTVLERMNGKPVVIRTLDIGGDKELPALNLPPEANPFLGVRAIRLCLQHPELFRTQLRALLRAAPFGNLKIMFPMITLISELREAKAILAEAKEQLLAEGAAFAEPKEIGIMIEVPSAALIADQLADEVDFFSIGSNDLIQYTMAADRMNERVSYLYQPFHPAVLHLIRHVIESAHRKGKWAGMCGEMASDPKAVPILLGYGLDEFSMNAASILRTRSQIRGLSKTDAILTPPFSE